MSANWSCLKCGTQVPAGMPSYLVVEGTFGSDPLNGKRKFEVSHNMHDALCAECHAEIKAGPAEDSEPELRSCLECHDEIKEDEGAVCQGCFEEAKARKPALEGGAVVAV